MPKSIDAFRTISEVADELDVPKHVLRFWEVKFNHIKPMKRGGGRRYYRPEDLELLRGIRHLLHLEGYTIKGVQKILREHGVDAVKLHGREPAVIAPPATTPVIASAPSAPRKSRAPMPKLDGAAPPAPAASPRPTGQAAANSHSPPGGDRAATRREQLRRAIDELVKCRELLLPGVVEPAASARLRRSDTRR